MENIVRERIYPPSVNPIPRLRLSPLLLMVFVMVVGFGVVIIGAKAVAQYTPLPSNPFPAYADVFPGQPASALETRAFSCQQEQDYDRDHYNLPEELYCTFTPTAGVFSYVAVKIYEDIIYQVTFTIRERSLQVGDLEMFLKMLKLHTLHRAAYFFLPGSFVIARTAGYTGQFSLFLPVWSVSFTEYPLQGQISP